MDAEHDYTEVHWKKKRFASHGLQELLQPGQAFENGSGSIFV